VTAANTIAADDTVIGGDGTDTLNFGANAANLTTLVGISEFEVVEVNGAVTVTVNTANVTASGSTITINETGANAAVTVSAAVAAGSTVILGEAASYTLADGVNNRVTIADEADSDADGLVSDESTETVTLGTGNDIVTGSASQDTIVLDTGSSTINTLGGADDIQSTLANLDGFHTIDGGEGTDSLTIASDGDADVFVENQFTTITSIETLALAGNGNTLSLGAKADAAGFVTITGGAGVDNITVLSTFDNALTITGGGAADVIDASGSAAVLTYTAGTGNDVDTVTLGTGGSVLVLNDAADIVTLSTGDDSVTFSEAGSDDNAIDILIITNGALNSADTIAGGGGTDIIRTSGAVTLADADFTNVTTMETIDAATNNGALTITAGALAEAAGIATINSGTGADTVNASAYTGAVTISTGDGADTITGGAGGDTITSGDGNDSIDVTEADGVTAVDSIIFGSVAANGINTITGFETGSDTVTIDADDTEAGNGAGNVALTAAVVNSAAALSAGGAFDVTASVNTATDDVIELLGLNYSNGDLSSATDGSELLKLMSVDGATASAMTIDNASDKFFLLAYDGGNAYLYHAEDTDAGTAVEADEITLVGIFNGIAVGGIATADLLSDA